MRIQKKSVTVFLAGAFPSLIIFVACNNTMSAGCWISIFAIMITVPVTILGLILILRDMERNNNTAEKTKQKDVSLKGNYYLQLGIGIVLILDGFRSVYSYAKHFDFFREFGGPWIMVLNGALFSLGIFLVVKAYKSLKG